MAETPNTKHQAPEKLQTPSSKPDSARGGIWSLELGVFMVFGVWCLVFSPVFPQPLLYVGYNRSARLLGGHLRVVDDLRAKGDYQGRGGPLAVALVAGGQVLLDAIGRPAARAFRQVRIEVVFEVGLRKNVGADVAAFHDQVAEFDALALRFLHPLTDFRHGRDVRDRRADLRRPDLLGRIIAIHLQIDMAVHALERGFPTAASSSDRSRVMHINLLLETIPGQRAIHRPGIDMDEPQRLGNELRVGALAAGAGAVDGDDDGAFGFRLRHLARIGQLNG